MADDDPTKGERGQQGDHGQHGDTGETGVRGETGRDGQTGLAGLPGERGKTGDQGQVGEAGAQGVSGVPGRTGLAGLPGDRGATGDQGQAGVEGAQGPPVLTRRQVLVMFLFIVLAFAAVAYRTEVVLNETKQQNNDIQRVLEVTKDAAVGHRNAARELIDCNTPGGACFQAQQDDARKLVDAISEGRRRDLIAAFICNDRSGGQQVKTLTACIDDLVERK